MEYTKNMVISQEGEYIFVLTNKKNRTTTYTFTLGHAYKIIEMIAPTCIADGYSVYGCPSCLSTYNADYIIATEHDYMATQMDVSCTKDGGVYHVCSNCGDAYVTDKVTAFGHAYEEETVAATCITEGCKRYTCTRCEYKYETDRTSVTGHSYVRQVQTEATCTENGVRTHLCERCGDYYTTDIPCMGHIYEIMDVDGEGGITVRTYACTTCGHSYTQNLGNQYEEVSNYVEYLFRQYSPYMIWVFVATAGVWSIAMGVSLLVAHKNEEKEKAKKMIVNYCIGLIVIFVILLAGPYMVRGIAWLVGK